METATFSIEEEARLIRKARWGSEAAFETLYHRHARAIHGLALRLTGDPATAEDITQDTFLRMLKFLGGLQPDRPLRPWLKQVASNAAIDRLRRDTLQGQYLSAQASLESVQEDIGSGMPISAESERLLQQLPPIARTVLWLHAAEGWSHAQLGQRFGYSESWSKSLVSRSLAQLRAWAGVESSAAPARLSSTRNPR